MRMEKTVRKAERVLEEAGLGCWTIKDWKMRSAYTRWPDRRLIHVPRPIRGEIVYEGDRIYKVTTRYESILLHAIWAAIHPSSKGDAVELWAKILQKRGKKDPDQIRFFKDLEGIFRSANRVLS